MSVESYDPLQQEVVNAESLNIFERMREVATDLRQRLGSIATAALLTVGAAVPSFVAEESVAPAEAFAADNAQVSVSMPFSGRWAYSNATSAECGSGSGQTSHPSCHETYFGDWATDLYAAPGAEVKLNVTSSKTLSFNWDKNASGSCGETRRVNVLADGNLVGRLHFTHMSDAASLDQEPTNGMIVGKIANLSCNPGGTGKHIHIEFDNASENTHSCYINHSDENHTAGMPLASTDSLGILGSSNTGTKQACSASETADPSAATTFSPSHPAVAVRDACNMDVFYRDTNNNLRDVGWTCGSGWGTPTVRSWGNVTGNPTAIARGPGEMDVFWVDTQGRLQDLGWDWQQGWGVPTVRATDLAGDPVAIARDANDMDVFYRDTNNNLLDVGWNALAGWHAPSPISYGDATGNPTATSRGADAMDVFYRDPSGNLRNAGWSAQTGWSRAATRSYGDVVGDPVVVSRTPTDMEVFYQDPYHNLKSIGWNGNGSGWGAPTYRSWGNVGSSPTAIARSSGDMSAFFADTNSNASLIEVGWAANGGGWSTPTPRTNGGAIGTPIAASRTATSVDVIFQDSSSLLKDQSWGATTGGWRQDVLAGTEDME